MAYEPNQEVKDVVAIVTVKMKFRTTLMGIDYIESDGTDEGAFKAAIADIGFDQWETAELDQIISIQED
jgi:hypothetical protein